MGADAGDELGEAERLGDEVDGAASEAGDDVDLLVAGGHDEDRQVRMVLDEVRADLVTVAVGEAEVEEDEVGDGPPELAEGIGDGAGDRDLVAVRSEGAAEARREQLVVLDEQQPCAGPTVRVGGVGSLVDDGHGVTVPPSPPPPATAAACRAPWSDWVAVSV